LVLEEDSNINARSSILDVSGIVYVLSCKWMWLVYACSRIGAWRLLQGGITFPRCTHEHLSYHWKFLKSSACHGS
jgi:hypothetical protein